MHGTNGIWGVISVGLFADGKSNYGGAWNGVPGSVTGLFYGDAGQLVAQLIGVATLIGFVFTFSFVLNLVIDAVVGQRVSAKVELEGLDIPEMGALGYPEFVLKAEAMATRSSHAMSTALVSTRDALQPRAAAHPAGSLAGPAYGLASGTGRLHPAARSGLPRATRSRPTCARASAWRTP